MGRQTQAAYERNRRRERERFKGLSWRHLRGGEGYHFEPSPEVIEDRDRRAALPERGLGDPRVGEAVGDRPRASAYRPVGGVLVKKQATIGGAFARQETHYYSEISLPRITMLID